MKHIVASEELISSKKEEMIAIAQIFTALLMAPMIIVLSWYA